MRRMLPILLVLALLSGCGSSSHPSDGKSDSPEGVLPLPVTEDSIREVYGEESKITPYGCDFLVYSSTDPNAGQFDWIYGKTGQCCPLTFCAHDILSYKITDTGQVQILQGTGNPINASRSFPSLRTAYAALRLDETGQPLPTHQQYGIETDSPYWAPRGECYTIGCPHGSEALVDLRVTIEGVEAVFGPTAENADGFFDAASSIPVTEITFAGDACILTFRDTVLESGTADPTSNATCGLPTSFPAGTLGDSNLFLSAADVRQEGRDVLVTLTLTPLAQTYTAENGQLLRNESRPFLRILFREAD